MCGDSSDGDLLMETGYEMVRYRCWHPSPRSHSIQLLPDQGPCGFREQEAIYGSDRFSLGFTEIDWDGFLTYPILHSP